MKERFAGVVEKVTPDEFKINGREIVMVTVVVRTIPADQVDSTVEDFDDGLVTVSCFASDAHYNALLNSTESGHVTAVVEASMINGRIRRSPISWKYDVNGSGFEPLHEIVKEGKRAQI